MLVQYIHMPVNHIMKILVVDRCYQVYIAENGFFQV